jgi:hypothetical protein
MGSILAQPGSRVHPEVEPEAAAKSIREPMRGQPAARTVQHGHRRPRRSRPVTSVILDVVIGVAVLGLLIFRQVRKRPVNGRGARLAAILAIVGIIEVADYLSSHHPDGTTYAAIGGSLVLAAAFGALRAFTVKIWTEGGQPWTQGNWLTAALWVVALGAHYGFDALVSHSHGNSNIADVTALLYLAVSLGVQRAIVSWRATKLPGVTTTGPVATPWPQGPAEGT